MIRPVRSLAPLLALASCTAPPAPVPPPPMVMAQPAPAPPPLAPDWRDWPVMAGRWFHGAIPGGAMARFAAPGGAPVLMLTCDAQRGEVVIVLSGPRPVPVSGQVRLLTSSGAHDWPVAIRPDGMLAATRAAGDGALDQMAFSRGRFAIHAGDGHPVVVPASPEVGRVVEDCRG